MPNGDLMLVSAPLFVWQSSRVFADTNRVPATYTPGSVIGVRIDAARRAHVILRPPVSGDLLWPRARYAEGTLHVVWATSTDTTQNAPLRADALWYATYDGRRWTTPQRIFVGRRIEWNELSAPPTLINGEPRLLVGAADSSESPDHAGLVYLARNSTGVWRKTWIPTRGPLPAFSGLAVHGDTSVAAFLGTVINVGNAADVNSVFVARSTDGGTTWAPPAVATRLGLAHGSDLQLAGSVPGGLHLVWDVDSTGATLVRHLESRDAGVTWRALSTQVVAGPIEELTVATSVAGRPIVVARRVGSDSLIVLDLGAQDSAAIRLPFEPAFGLPHLSALSGDSLVLVWGVARPHTYPLFPSIAPLASMMAILDSRCR